jgi:SpoIID/LytB domain protein
VVGRSGENRGEILFSSGPTEPEWKVRRKYGQPAEMIYWLVLYEEKESADSQRRIQELQDRGWRPKVIEVGKELRLGGRLLSDNRQFWVSIGPYATRSEADTHGMELPDDAVPRVIADLATSPLGALDLIDPSGRVVFSSAEPFALIPMAGESAIFTVFDVTVGRGFSFERQEDRMYHGLLEFRVGNDGMVLAVNELPLEVYLKGTLPKEMNPGFPEPALRAQAIAARSYTIARWGIQHRLDSFDLCAEVHCQAYAGVGKEHPVTNLAVDQTRGQVLMHGDGICETFYSAVCGGHTENNENVWGGSPRSYLRGIPDIPTDQREHLPSDLGSDEEALRAWIHSVPPAHCNHLSDDAPRSTHYTRKYFRWSFTYSRQELEQILLEKLGADIGYLLDIVPVERGVSGRLISVLIAGDEDEVMVKGELNIRRALSPTHLHSACFVVSRQMGPDGLPGSFVFEGAGWGHGAGMCQSGAAGMAQAGATAEEILTHYYRSTEVRQIYGAAF